MKSDTPLTDESSFLGFTKASFARELEKHLNRSRESARDYLDLCCRKQDELDKLKAQLESNVKMRSDMLAAPENQETA